MTSAGGTYTRFVQTAKIVLPLLALGLFATLFLLADKVDPEAAIPYSDVDVEQYAREARIGAPEFSGMTEDGTVVSMAAEVARPDQNNPGRMTAEGVDARFEVPDGSLVEAVAGAAAVDSGAKEIALTDGVEITTSTGYRITSKGLTATLSQTSLITQGHVTAEGPPGRIEAGQASLYQSTDNPNAYVLVFIDGVKLIYDPKN